MGPLPASETAYRRLRDDIVACRLAPGQRLTERNLAAETGFGISPIREALTRLDQEGLVATLPRKGYQVKPLTLKSVDELFGFWAVLGPEIVRLAIKCGTVEQLEQVRSRLQTARGLTNDKPADPGSTRRLTELADETFELLAEATTNEYLIVAYRRLVAEIGRIFAMIMDWSFAESANFSMDDWSDLIRRRDEDTAAETAFRYIQEAHEHVLRVLTRWPSVINAEVVPLERADDTGNPPRQS